MDGHRGPADFDTQPDRGSKRAGFLRSAMLLLLPAIVGGMLLVGTIRENSATYDEVAYARIACRWWRSGDQAEITRMGSPVTFWKWQAVPALALLDATGRGGWIDEPRASLPEILPWLRASAAWLWFLGLFAVQGWAGRAYGRVAAIFAGWVYVLSPNLRAHGALMTMETPLWAFVAVSTLCLCERFRTGRRSWAALSAVAAGAAFSMKFTAVALPVLFGGVVALREFFELRRQQTSGFVRPAARSVWSTAKFGAGFVTIMIATNLILTGFARIEPSERKGSHPWLESRFRPAVARRLERILETPLPVDWVGFANQLRHQRSGGPGYLFGEISNQGWPQYYLVAMAVKCPPVVLIVLLLRPFVVRRGKCPEEWLIPAICLAFIAVACLTSKRNYGFRYLLPLAPLAIVWLSGLTATLAGRAAAIAMTGALAWASAVSHPYELTYFNALCGGRSGGHRVLADSNLDWGQGLIALRKTLADRPVLADTTLFYFGDVEPGVWGIDLKSYLIDASDNFSHLPLDVRDCRTEYVAVSTSLIFGPWGPRDYFSVFAGQEPVAVTADGTIRIYRTAPMKLSSRVPRGRPCDSVITVRENNALQEQVLCLPGFPQAHQAPHYPTRRAHPNCHEGRHKTAPAIRSSSLVVATQCQGRSLPGFPQPHRSQIVVSTEPS